MNLFRPSNKAAAVNPLPQEPTTSDQSSHEDDEKNATVSGVDTNQHAGGTIHGEDRIESCMGSEHDVCDEPQGNNSLDTEHYMHNLHEGDHIVRWTMLGYCYPVQVHGIVLSVGPELVTIIDCGLTAVKIDKAGSFDEDGKVSSSWMKTRRRMNVLTLVDEKEIKKWKKVHYGEEYKLRMQSTISDEPQFDDVSTAEGLYPDLEYERESTEPTEYVQVSKDTTIENECEQSIADQTTQKPSFWPFCSQKSAASKMIEDTEHNELQDTVDRNSQHPKNEDISTEKTTNTFRLPKSDPPALVLARLRFLLEHAEAESAHNNTNNEKTTTPTPLLPPHHIFYANSECIAVWVKTGHWSTLQAAVFLHSSTIGNVKQTATLAMYLSAQTVTIPAAGIWGFFGGTTTISLFSAQPWIVPALVGGGVVYAGLPTVVLWRAKSRWLETEKKLNVAFWENVDSSVIVILIQTWSGLEG